MYDKVKKIYALSDAHGYFTPMKAALDAAGFNPEDESHLLVFCGDMFDRGSENLSVYQYLSGLKNKILIRGNHDERLIRVLQTGQLEYYDVHNQTDKTLAEFFGDGCVDENLRLHVSDEALAEKLIELYRSERDYFELDDYIFTHGWLPAEVYESTPYLIENWSYATEEKWSSARWLEWQQMYSKRETTLIPGKTIVCGHRPSAFGYMFDHSRFNDDYGIFYGDGMVAIDGWTVRSGKVNVLVLDVGNVQKSETE